MKAHLVARQICFRRHRKHSQVLRFPGFYAPLTLGRHPTEVQQIVALRRLGYGWPGGAAAFRHRLDASLASNPTHKLFEASIEVADKRVNPRVTIKATPFVKTF